MKKIIASIITIGVFIGGIIIHNEIYNIHEKDIVKNIKLSLKEKNDIKILKEESVNGSKAILCSSDEKKNEINLVILDKGLNNQYRISSVIGGSNRYTTYKKSLLKEYIIEAGDNRKGNISYISDNQEKKSTKIDVEKDFFIKFINLDQVDEYNLYNKENKAVDL